MYSIYLEAENYIIMLVIFFRSSFEGFFASKGAAYALPDGDFARRATKHGGKESRGLQSLLMQMKFSYIKLLYFIFRYTVWYL